MRRREWLAGAGALAAAGRAWSQAPAAAPVDVELATDLGPILVRLRPDVAPLTCANFLRYVDTHRLDRSVFYRAARAKGVEGVGLIEGGLQNDPARLLPPVAHEPTSLTGLAHGDGALSMARDAPGTATADFFVCCGPAPYLDARPGAAGDNAGYAVFGAVTEGMDVARAILARPSDGPARNPVMQGQMLDAPVRILRATRRI